MSHIHLPDGVLSPFWWIFGYIACFAVIWLLVRKIKDSNIRRKIPFAGMVGALMLIFMSVPLGILPVHLSLAALCGILAGPALGFLAAFAVNVILAFMGHGGITVVGINTLLLGGEAVLGFFIYKALSQKTGSALSAGVASALSLLASTALMVALVSASIGLNEALPSLGHISEPEGIHSEFLSFSGWTAVGIITLTGIFLESLITGLIVRFFAKVRPDLVGFNEKR